MLSEESSSYPDDSGLDLGLGLSLGGGKSKNDGYGRIFTVDKVSSSSSSSSSSSVINNGFCGMKRIADEPSSPPGRSSLSQVVGWPPIRNHKVNSLVNNAKTPGTEEFASIIDRIDKTKNGGLGNNNVAKKTSVFVKVNMDGIQIGRKVDLSAHSCYGTLARTLNDMFRPSATVGAREEKALVAGTRRHKRLFNDASDFVLTYEDKDGDWMLVGDVPWDMFYSSVRRLRIMRTAEANGLAPTSH